MDVIRFLDQHQIYYRDSGPNCGRNGVVIKCPFCGDDDPSEHLGIHLPTAYWHCLRNAKHSGRKPQRLIRALTGCSREEADSIAEGGVNLDAFSDAIRKLRGDDEPTTKHTPLKLPKEFRKLTERGSGLFYWTYLLRRGFRDKDIPRIARRYDLRFCTEGNWRGRILFPIYLNGELVTWTGRSISRRAQLRYLHPDATQNSSLLTPKSVLYDYDHLCRGGVALVIVEGPLDALKVGVYGRPHGIRATCLFGAGVTEDQVALLATLRGRFTKLVILGDEGADANVAQLQDELAVFRPSVARLPSGVEDPGDLTPRQAGQIARALSS